MAPYVAAFHGFWLTLTASLAAGILLQNVALNKHAAQSSGADADRAVDGDINPDFNSGFCSLTRKETDPWWSVDLGKTHKIHSVVVTSSDRAEYRLDDVKIRISDSLESDWWKRLRCGKIGDFAPSQSMYRSCYGYEGRFVTLRLPGDRALSLCEVKVYAADFAYPTANAAVKGEAVQSSTLSPATANRAIDGRRDTYYTDGSCSHTKEETAPWWRVDLGQLFFISQVKVTNRGDCCPERLDGAQIRVGNSLENNGNDNTRCANITHIPLGQTLTFDCESNTVRGRYVNLVLPGDMKILTLCEVEVYADPAVRVLENVAQNKPLQTEGRNTLLKVNLGAVYRVSAVVVYAWGNCCLEDMIGARIQIGKRWTPRHNPMRYNLLCKATAGFLLFRDGGPICVCELS